jgi:mono/diheme cytochrome c family protein
VFDAYLVALAVSLLVNDTPNDVLGMGTAIAVALARDPRRDVLVSWRPMRRAATFLALLAVIGGTVAGCGGGEEAAPVPETVEGELPEATTTEAGGGEEGPEGDAAAGEQVYASAGCGGCHTLEAAGSSGSVGPNLDESQPSLELALDRVRNGQGAMPAYEGQLDDQQIADVAAFVVESTS